MSEVLWAQEEVSDPLGQSSAAGVQVKELGAVVYNCSCLAADLEKIFEAYWFVGANQSIPSPWPSSFSTPYNKDTPLQLPLNHTPSSVYLSVRKRNKSFIFVSSLTCWRRQSIRPVFDYLPSSEFASIVLRSWPDSGSSVHPQRDR